MKTVIENSKKDLQVIANRLASMGINVTIDVTRENTPGEYPSILIWKDNYERAIAELHSIRKMINSNESKFSCDYTLEIGYTNESAVFEIRPRYSYMLESERKQLGF